MSDHQRLFAETAERVRAGLLTPMQALQELRRRYSIVFQGFEKTPQMLVKLRELERALLNSDALSEDDRVRHLLAVLEAG
ncbi:MAG TPA: hypothetical protein PLD59_04325 [Tepidisphaeraceae bacterium]|nr:hypothetical protein [Tepidisphaeraceae bacterium]